MELNKVGKLIADLGEMHEPGTLNGHVMADAIRDLLAVLDANNAAVHYRKMEAPAMAMDAINVSNHAHKRLDDRFGW